jgi:hypothetical protein
MEQKWIDKLKNYEAMPPAQLWDRVESALEQGGPAFARKLQDFEAAPPLTAWDRIEAQLETAPEAAAPLVAMPSRRRSFAPYLAAAALIGVIAVSAALLFNRPETGTDRTIARIDTPAQKAITGTKAETAPDSPANTGTNVAVSDERPKESRPFENDQATNTIASTRSNNNNSRQVSNDKTLRASGDPVQPAARSLASNTGGTTHSRSVDEERYLVRAYNDGSVVRFSKKVSPVVDCAENATGFTQSLCRVSIGAVQDKLATSVTTDFGSLMERLQDLEKGGR